MKIIYNGHSCFTLETAGGVIVLDPYADGSVPGLRALRLRADAVHCSHSHSDHNAVGCVTLTGGAFTAVISEIPCAHDDEGGKKRGSNLITVIDDGISRVAHFGDVGEELSDDIIAAIGRVDATLIPVGGYYTIDAPTARRIALRVGARVSIPMHYRGRSFGFSVLSPADGFFGRQPHDVFENGELTLAPDGMPPFAELTPKYAK